MIEEYPQLSKEQVSRQGETWWHCDDPKCNASTKVEEAKTPKNCPNCEAETTGSRFCAECGVEVAVPDVPKGWRTSDPDDNPLKGAAQRCPKHANAISVLPAGVDVPEPIVEG